MCSADIPKDWPEQYGGIECVHSIKRQSSDDASAYSSWTSFEILPVQSWVYRPHSSLKRQRDLGTTLRSRWPWKRHCIPPRVRCPRLDSSLPDHHVFKRVGTTHLQELWAQFQRKLLLRLRSCKGARPPGIQFSNGRRVRSICV